MSIPGLEPTGDQSTGTQLCPRLPTNWAMELGHSVNSSTYIMQGQAENFKKILCRVSQFTAVISYFICNDLKKRFNHINGTVMYEYIFCGGVYYPFKTNSEIKAIYGRENVSYGG